MSERRRNPGHLTRYAEHAGISKEAARKQLKKVGIDYFQDFDFAQADIKRLAARNAARMKFSKPAQPADRPNEDDDDDEKFIFAEHQAKREYYRAEQARLEYEERIKKLTDTAGIRKVAFDVGRQVRDAMLNIPPRMAGVLAAETNERRVHDILQQAILQALEVLSAHTHQVA